jgi:hypothetical protein
MTSPPERIQVQCPSCGATYTDWWRPSINLTLDRFDPAYITDATTASCPHCKFQVALDVLIIRQDGTWEVAGS